MNSSALPTQIGKYWVKRLLGTGGMGRVFLAVDPDIGREVAIKLVTLGGDPQANERFLREAQTMGRLNHPNVVTLLEFGVDNQSPFLVLEFLSGEDLSQWMLRPHTLREQVQVMLDVAQAISAAHKVGVLHRDLKPENVRVLDDGRCKLLDFGIAQSGAGQLTAAGYFVGTPEFVAPEVMSGATHSAAADIYALGLLFYTMLCGDNPFRGDTVQVTVARVVQREAPPLATRISGLPEALAELIARCMAKQPELRPASAEAVVQSLIQELSRITPEQRLSEAHRPAATAPYPVTPAPSKTHAAQVLKPAPDASAARGVWALILILSVVIAASFWWLLQPASTTPPRISAAPSSLPTKPAAAPDVVKPVPEVLQPATDAVMPATDKVSAPAGAMEPAAQETPTTVQREPELDPARSGAKTMDAADAKATPTSPSTERRSEPTPALPQTAAADPAALPAPLPSTAIAAPEPRAPIDVPLPTAAEPTALPEETQVQVNRYSPRVLRAGRSVTVRLQGQGLAAVRTAVIHNSGAPDPRFRIGELKHDGDDTLEFALNVNRGVPLGAYALILQGDGVRAEPILLELSL